MTIYSVSTPKAPVVRKREVPWTTQSGRAHLEGYPRSPLCVTHQKALFRRQPVALRKVHVLHLILPDHPAKDDSPEVSDVLAFGERSRKCR